MNYGTIYEREVESISEEIDYQNKDILFKILGQTYKEKSFVAYGIDLPPIRELLSTDLLRIAANEKALIIRFYWKMALCDYRLRIRIKKRIRLNI